jgi:hypothetical protein
MRILDVAKKVFVALLEIIFLWADTILLVGFTFFNNLRTSPISHVGLVLMLLGDAISFVLSWWRPRLGGILLLCVSAISLILVMLGATKEGVVSLWLTAAIFWGAKGLLCLILLRQPSRNPPIERVSDSLSLL